MDKREILAETSLKRHSTVDERVAIANGDRSMLGIVGRRMWANTDKLSTLFGSVEDLEFSVLDILNSVCLIGQGYDPRRKQRT